MLSLWKVKANVKINVLNYVKNYAHSIAINVGRNAPSYLQANDLERIFIKGEELHPFATYAFTLILFFYFTLICVLYTCTMYTSV